MFVSVKSKVFRIMLPGFLWHLWLYFFPQGSTWVESEGCFLPVALIFFSLFSEGCPPDSGLWSYPAGHNWVKVPQTLPGIKLARDLTRQETVQWARVCPCKLQKKFKPGLVIYNWMNSEFIKVILSFFFYIYILGYDTLEYLLADF